MEFFCFSFYDNLKSVDYIGFFDPPRLPNRNYRCDFIACSPSRGELEPVSFIIISIKCRFASPKSGRVIARRFTKKSTRFLFSLNGYFLTQGFVAFLNQNFILISKTTRPRDRVAFAPCPVIC